MGTYMYTYKYNNGFLDVLNRDYIRSSDLREISINEGVLLVNELVCGVTAWNACVSRHSRCV